MENAIILMDLTRKYMHSSSCSISYNREKIAKWRSGNFCGSAVGEHRAKVGRWGKDFRHPVPNERASFTCGVECERLGCLNYIYRNDCTE